MGVGGLLVVKQLSAGGAVFMAACSHGPAMSVFGSTIRFGIF
jgi:hypothetical protein